MMDCALCGVTRAVQSDGLCSVCGVSYKVMHEFVWKLVCYRSLSVL